MLPTPQTLAADSAYAPLLRVCESVLLTANEVAKHYRYEPEHLANMRRRSQGPAFIKLGAGAIRYRLSEVLGWELAGQAGPITLERISVALAAMPALQPAMREAIEKHLAATLAPRETK